MDWSDEKIAKLRKLWDDGLSANRIAEELFVSKNAVIGKSHRLKLPARPSPIRLAGDKPKRIDNRQRVRTKKTLATLPSLMKPAAVLSNPKAGPSPRRSAPTPLDRAVIKTEPPRVRRPNLVNPPFYLGCCTWVSGDPPLYSCSEPITRGAYCQEHAKRVYLRVDARQYDEATEKVAA